MAPDPKSVVEDEPDREQSVLEEEAEEPGDDDGPAYHPPAPPDELFEISTTVDPSYIISLIRKLLPIDVKSGLSSYSVDDSDAQSKGFKADILKESGSSRDGVEAMDVGNDFDSSAFQEREDADLHSKLEKPGVSVGEEAWEEYGCILWDLAASRTHAELMVENLVLEVLLGNLMVSQSVRVTEIVLGIIGNLGCHEVLMRKIVATNGLVEKIVKQLFLDDTQCLCEAFRVLTLGLQGAECIAWAEALQSEHVMSRIIWVAENTLNPQLLGKSFELILAVVESGQEVMHALLSPLMNLGLPSLLVNLLAFEMEKLTSEKLPERYSVLDIVLRAIEALSVTDGHSQEISSNKELFALVCDLVKLPDKTEIANCCVTAGVLIANILSDAPDLASEIWQDLHLLQGLLDIFPFASDDYEARSALWSIMARLLIKVAEDEMSPSSLCNYVSVLVSRADPIEDDLLDCQLDNSNQENKNLTDLGTRSNARTIALKRIISILNKWTTLKNYVEEDNLVEEYHADDAGIRRLLDCCIKYSGLKTDHS